MKKLKASEVAAYRNLKLQDQGGRCAMCSYPCSTEQAVLDHDHETGAVRGVAHRGCNAVEGKIVNSYRRYGVPCLPAFLNGLARYHQKHLTNITGLLHPTHKTDDEKRLARNEKARKARALKAKGTT